jgi:hypothetical protein
LTLEGQVALPALQPTPLLPLLGDFTQHGAAAQRHNRVNLR